ncbi:MAG: recombination regulator RecX [Clostridiales bacterium]|jgi:regulatory protein|nr:recombination regulator RecX [Clostridiales bacterium]
MKKPDFSRRDMPTQEFAASGSNVEFAEAYRVALRLLGIKPRTEHEILIRIMEKYSSETAARVIALLRHYQYIDDERYALDYCHERMSYGYGNNRIRMELKNRGVEDSIINRAIGNVCLGNEMPRIAQSVLDKRYPDGVSQDIKGRQKQYGFLLRRGFDTDTIERVLNAGGQ